MNVYDSLVRFAVPIFVMISGALFLQRDIPTKIIYTKYILKLSVAYIFWSLIYSLYYGGNLSRHVINFINSTFHLWFIPMIIGLYIAYPIIMHLFI